LRTVQQNKTMSLVLFLIGLVYPPVYFLYYYVMEGAAPVKFDESQYTLKQRAHYKCLSHLFLCRHCFTY